MRLAKKNQQKTRKTANTRINSTRENKVQVKVWSGSGQVHIWFWFRSGSGLVPVRFRSASGPVQVWFRSGSGPVQVRFRPFRSGSGLVQVRFRSGSGPVQVRFGTRPHEASSEFQTVQYQSLKRVTAECGTILNAQTRALLIRRSCS